MTYNNSGRSRRRAHDVLRCANNITNKNKATNLHQAARNPTKAIQTRKVKKSRRKRNTKTPGADQPISTISGKAMPRPQNPGAQSLSNAYHTDSFGEDTRSGCPLSGTGTDLSNVATPNTLTPAGQLVLDKVVVAPALETLERKQNKMQNIGKNLSKKLS